MKAQIALNLKKYLVWVLATFLLIWLLVALSFYQQIDSWKAYLALQMETGKMLAKHPFTWFLAHIPYGLRFFFISFRTVYQKRGKLVLAKRFSAIVLLPVVFGFVGLQYADWYTQEKDFEYAWDYSVENAAGISNELFKKDGKIRGVHYFGSRRNETDIMGPITKNNIEWVVLVPYGYQPDYNSPDIRISRSRPGDQNRPSQESRYIRLIKEAKAQNIGVMIKPHIWLGSTDGGKWRSDIDMKTDAEWETWKANYKEFILFYAKISEAEGLPFFCIGAELHNVVKEQPAFWKDLIKDVRKVYSGKLTFGANWYLEYEDVTFWDDLDYIGIQAYFPLTKKENPGVDELVKGWKPHLKKIEALSKKHNKPILFTEIGYKSSCDAAIEPWAWVNTLSGLYEKVSTETQANCYEAFFKVFWDKDWFAGALFWEWKGYDGASDHHQQLNFTPYNKPASNVMAKWFGRVGKEVTLMKE
ncbi:MAG: hypothetical protein R2828_17320 [Saprospiraceae bacterium]